MQGIAIVGAGEGTDHLLSPRCVNAPAIGSSKGTGAPLPTRFGTADIVPVTGTDVLSLYILPHDRNDCDLA
jgi:hypothetical protein